MSVTPTSTSQLPMQEVTHLDVGFTAPDGVSWGPELNPNIHIVSVSSGFFAKLSIDT